MSKEDRIQICENRRNIYVFLSRVYERELTQEMLHELTAQQTLSKSIGALSELRGTRVEKGFKNLVDSVEAMRGRDPAQVQLELAADYAGLFLGVGGTPAHPSESVYRSSTHLIMQKARDDVLEIYRKMGLEKTANFTEPEDHIAVELQFMAFLARQTVDALKADKALDAAEYLEAQRSFLTEHLCRWAPQFSKDILKNARRDFYKAVAQITAGYLTMDLEAVEGLLEGLKPKP
jgi:anaerobic sulfite reductase subunit A